MEITEIKAYMKKYKITYSELAAMTGINLTSIKRIFCGKTKKPHLETMVAIEQALGFINTNSRTAAPMSDDLHYSEEEKKLIEDYRVLNTASKKLVKQTVETLRATAAQSEQKKGIK